MTSLSRFASRAAPALAAAGLLLAGACGTQKTTPVEPVNPPDPSATFTRVQREVFSPSCAFSGCHAGATPQQGMSLEPGKSYGSVVGVSSRETTRLRVSPGRPEESYLVSKVRGDATIVGGRMPFGGPALPDAQVQLIVDWIRRGAPDD